MIVKYEPMPSALKTLFVKEIKLVLINNGKLVDATNNKFINSPELLSSSVFNNKKISTVLANDYIVVTPSTIYLLAGSGELQTGVLSWSLAKLSKLMENVTELFILRLPKNQEYLVWMLLDEFTDNLFIVVSDTLFN